jgi:hypothetical protein
MGDTGVTGGAHPRMRYWSAGSGMLSLYDADGRPRRSSEGSWRIADDALRKVIDGSRQ